MPHRAERIDLMALVLAAGECHDFVAVQEHQIHFSSRP
jgi:hypothetical protein